PADAPAATFEREATASPLLARHRGPRQPRRRRARRPGGRRPAARMGRGDSMSVAGARQPRRAPQRRLEPGLACPPRPRLPRRAGGRARRGARGGEARGRDPRARGDAAPLPEHGVVVAAGVRRSRRGGTDEGGEEPADRRSRPRAMSSTAAPRPEFFLTPADLAAWFAANPSATELWVGLWKKGFE